MKKKFLLVAALLLSVLTQKTLFAQSTSHNLEVKGNNFLNAGIGLGSYGLTGTGGLPVTASFEHGFGKNISAGIEAGFVKRTFEDAWKYTYIIFGARGSYHFNQLLKINNPKVDLYSGLGLIYRHSKFTFSHIDMGDGPDFSSEGSAGTVDFELHAGGRYFFSKNFGAYAELGYGISPLQLGLTLKF